MTQCYLVFLYTNGSVQFMTRNFEVSPSLTPVKDLKAYIDTMMVNIIEDAPDLLQAMSRPTNGTSSLKRSQSTRGSWFGGGR